MIAHLYILPANVHTCVHTLHYIALQYINTNSNISIHNSIHINIIITVHYITLHDFTILHITYISLHDSTIFYITLHYFAFVYIQITLHYTTIHYSTEHTHTFMQSYLCVYTVLYYIPHHTILYDTIRY